MAKVVFLDDGTWLVRKLKKSFVKGLTELSASETRSALQALADKANKRIRNIANNGLYSPAVESLKRTSFNDTFSVDDSGHISVHTRGAKVAQIAQMRSAIASIQRFLGDETSTVSGARNYRRDVESRLGLEKTSPKALSVVWRVIDRVKQVNPIIANYQALASYIYDCIEEDVGDFTIIDSLGESEIANMIDDLAGKAAKQTQEMYYDAIRKGFSKL